MSFFSRFTGQTCPRLGCGHKSPKGSEYCERCGVPMALRRPAILEDNRWSAADDELAVFFKFKRLDGWLTKNFTVPPGMCAWVMAGEGGSLQVVESLSEGTHTAETFLERMNTFFRGKPGEVLIVRMATLPLAFKFDEIFCAELLPLRVALQMPVRVVEPLSFRRHFMLQEGAVTQALLQDLVRPALKAALAEALGQRELQKMAGDPNLRQALGDEVRARMQPQLKEWGLDVQPLHDLEVWHEAFDEYRRKSGELWLATKNAALQAELDQQAKAHADGERNRLEALYSQEAWDRISKRRDELNRAEEMDKLDAREQDMLRAKEVRRRAELHFILKADTEDEARKLGADYALAELKATFLDKQRKREQQELGDRYSDTSAEEQWKHVQALARIANESAQTLARQKAQQDLILDKIIFETTLQQHAINKAKALTQALREEAETNADHEALVNEIARNAARQQLIKDTQARMEAAQHVLAAQLKAADSLRVAQLEDAQLASKINRLAADDARYAGDKKLDGLERLSDISMKRKLQKQVLELRAEKERHQLEQEALDKQVDRDLRLRDQQFKEDMQKGSHDIEKMRITGSLPAAALVSLANDPAQIASLTSVALVEIYGRMTPEQIKAAGAANGLAQAAPAPAPSVFAAAPVPSGPSAAELMEAMTKSINENLGQTYERFMDRQERSQTAQNELNRHAMDLLAKAQENTANAIGRPAAAPVVVSVQAQAPASTMPLPQATAHAAVYPQTHAQMPWATAPQPMAPGYMAATAQAGVAAGQQRCSNPQCQAPLALGTRFCSHCGAPITGA